MISIALYALLCVVLSLLVVWSLIRCKRTVPGLALGLVPIVVMEAAFHGTLWLRVHRCLEDACLAKGLPSVCGLTEFGCTEWSGAAAFMFWAAGFAALVLYAIGAAVLAARARRRLP